MQKKEGLFGLQQMKPNICAYLALVPSKKLAWTLGRLECDNVIGFLYSKLKTSSPSSFAKGTAQHQKGDDFHQSTPAAKIFAEIHWRGSGD